MKQKRSKTGGRKHRRKDSENECEMQIIIRERE
jgi:hypothetical protein